MSRLGFVGKEKREKEFRVGCMPCERFIIERGLCLVGVYRNVHHILVALIMSLAMLCFTCIV